MLDQFNCTVVIPAYNAAKHIEETVSSVLASAEVSAQIIIVDDGSTDNTPAILSELARKHNCITVVRIANAGVSSARNTGLALASSPFICFLDADDRLTADALAVLCRTLDSDTEAAAAYGDVQYIDEKSKTYVLTKRNTAFPLKSPVTISSILQRNLADTPGAILFRTALIKQVGGFDSKLLYAEDWELYVRLACLGTFVHCGTTVIDYRLHASSAMSSKRLTHRDFEPALAKVFNAPAERYGLSAQMLKIYEHRMRVRVQEVIILKSKGFKTQLRNVREIVSTLLDSNLEPALIKATAKGILSATIRVF